MTNLILTLIICSTVITSIINCVKPAYKKFTGKYTITVNTVLSFVLGILASFSLASYLAWDYNTGLLILLGFALGSGSNIFYDCWELVKGLGVKLNETVKAIEE